MSSQGSYSRSVMREFESIQFPCLLELYLKADERSNVKPSQLAVVRIAIAGGWFEALNEGQGPKTASDLARVTGAEEMLIGK